MDADLDRRMMRRAIDLAVRSGREGEYPYGVVIARSGEVVAESINRVAHERDVTRHAEVVAIREACQSLGRFELRGCELYTSCEPCPMCLAAIHWAKIDRVVFGATIADAAAAGERLKERLKEAKIPPAPVLACLGRDRIIVKDIRYPAVPALFILACLLLIVAPAVQAQMYKCTEGGKTRFSDKPFTDCKSQSVQGEIKPPPEPVAR